MCLAEGIVYGKSRRQPSLGRGVQAAKEDNKVWQDFHQVNLKKYSDYLKRFGAGKWGFGAGGYFLLLTVNSKVCFASNCS